MEKTVLRYDYTTIIVVTKRSDDYHACIKGHPEIWGCGEDIDDAIGDLVRSHKSEFNIEIQYGKKEHKYDIYVIQCRCGFKKYVGISPALAMMRPDMGTSYEVIAHFNKISKCCKRPKYFIEY